MAANRNANKIVYGAKTLIDLTTDTVQVQHPGKRGDAYALRITGATDKNNRKGRK